MYNFIIVLEKPATNFQLGFKEKGMADAAKVKVRAAMDAYEKQKDDARITVKDDYGREMDAFASNIRSVLIEDHQLKMEMQNDQNIDTARANDVFIKNRNDNVELMRLFPTQSSIHPAIGRA